LARLAAGRPPEELATASIARGNPGGSAREVRLIVVNRSWELAPWADLCYGADAQWWRGAANCPGFAGIKVCGQAIEFRDVAHIKVDSKAQGLSLDPAMLVSGGNSGYQAVNLAALAGASRILLVGFDMRAGPGGALHWHPPHRARNPFPHRMGEWAAKFRDMVPGLATLGVEVVNCTPGSAIDAFPFATLEEVL
jgi:hypothetical protein